MTPAERALCGQRAAAHVEGRRGAQTDRRKGRIRRPALAGQRRRATRLAETIRVQVHIGEIGEGLEPGGSHAEAVGQFAKDLRRPRIVVAFQSIAEAGEAHAAVRRNIVPRISCAGTEGEIAPLRAAIEADMVVVART